MDCAEKKSELSTKLKEICAEIESKDGRKVELIKRVIVSNRLNKGTKKFGFLQLITVALHSHSNGQGSRLLTCMRWYIIFERACNRHVTVCHVNITLADAKHSGSLVILYIMLYFELYIHVAPTPRPSKSATPYGGHAVIGTSANGYGRPSSSHQGTQSRQDNSSWQPQHQRGRGRGKERGRGRGRGGFTHSPSPGYSNLTQESQRGGYGGATRRGGGGGRSQRGRGQRGRGRAHQAFSGNHSDTYSGHSNYGGGESQHTFSDGYSSHSNFGGEPQYTYSDSVDSGAGQFDGHGYRRGSGHQHNQSWGMSGVNRPPVSPLQLSADPPHLSFRQPPGQNPSPLYGGPPISSPQSGGHHFSHSPMQRGFPSHHSPTSPWPTPTQLPPPPPQAAMPPSSHLQPYHQRQPQQGHQQQFQFGAGGEHPSAAGPSFVSSQGTSQEPVSAVMKSLVSYTYRITVNCDL